MSYWPLLGVAVVVVGFALRRNPALVVVMAALVSGIAAGKPLGDLLALIGSAFIDNRALLLLALTLPVIGVLERYGLRERARDWIAGFRGLNLTRFLVSYLGVRQVLSMFGLTHVAGHAQTVRPLVAPMAEAAAERQSEPLDADERERVRAMAAATDNVGLFFGEDVFLAFGGVLLIQRVLAERGIALEPLHIALWALPTAVAAFVIHGLRILWFERGLRRARAARREAINAHDARSAASNAADAKGHADD